MGCIISCLACNAASCLCSGICNVCGKAVPMSTIGSRIIYSVIFFLISFVAWILGSWAKNILQWVPVLKSCTETDGSEGQVLCYGTLAVYRISFVLALFHGIMALIMIGVSRKIDCRNSIQDGWWGIKAILLLGGIVGAFFIPNIFFQYFGWVALAASGIFILVQLLLLVDFAHSWAENWIGKYEESEEGDKRWWYLMLIVACVLYGISLVGSILMGIFFCKDAMHCGARNVAFLTLNAVLCFLLSAASIHPKVQDASPRSGLLQSSIVTAYCTYLVYSAMMSGTDCNPFLSSGSASKVSVLIGAVFTIIAVCYTTVRAASFVGKVNDSEETEPLKKEENGEASSDEKKEDKDAETASDPDEPVAYHYSKFHAIFALGALYLAMLMTDWHTVYDINTPEASVDTGLVAVWIKAVTSWICVGLYLWTLAGPALFPNRDWS